MVTPATPNITTPRRAATTLPITASIRFYF
jgi:hypothetical protein